MEKLTDKYEKSSPPLEQYNLINRCLSWIPILYYVLSWFCNRINYYSKNSIAWESDIT